MSNDLIDKSIDDSLKRQKSLRVLMVVPALPKDEVSMIFVKRHIDMLEKAGLKVHRYFLESRTSFSQLIKSLHSFLRLQSEFKPDVVHSNYGAMTAFFCAIAAKVPLVVTYRGSDLNPNSNVGLLRISTSHLLSQLAALHASRIVCVSEQLKLRLWWPSARSRTTIIPSPVNMEIFKVINMSEARRLLGWQQEDKVVLFNAGKRQPGKRLDLAQNAVQVASSRINNIRFVVLEGNVSPDKVPLLMNAADCLLMTSDYEGSPNVVKEAMACDLPIVSVDVGDVSERLREVMPSSIVARDPLAIGKAIINILNQQSRSNGRSIAKRDLSEVSIIQNTLNVYHSALTKV